MANCTSATEQADPLVAQLHQSLAFSGDINIGQSHPISPRNPIQQPNTGTLLNEDGTIMVEDVTEDVETTNLGRDLLDGEQIEELFPSQSNNRNIDSPISLCSNEVISEERLIFDINDAPMGEIHAERLPLTEEELAAFEADPLNQCIYGDVFLEDYDDNFLMLGFANTNGLRREKYKEKNKAIKRFLRKYKLDIFGLTEPNLHWDSLDPTDRWEARMAGMGWKHAHHNIAFNTTDDSTQEWQPGGCILTSLERMVHRKISSGADPTGLGRWCWTRYRGRHDVTLRVITAYRTCVTSKTGPRTAHSQQQRYLHANDDDRTPRQAMLADLCTALKQYKDSGDQLIVMMDANEDVTDSEIQKRFKELGLIEAITSRHKDKGFVPTYQRGRVPIDGIFLSPTLKISEGGYFPFGEFPLDHRFLWIKIEFTNALGYQMPPLVSPEARRMKTDDPKCTKRFLDEYEKYITKNGMHLTAFELQEKLINEPLSPTFIRQYNHLQRLRHKGIQYGDRRCRKLKKGEVPWSRTLQNAMDHIALWKAVISRKSGTRVSTRFISRLEKAVKTPNSLKISKKEAKDKLTQAYKRYYELKKDADELRDSWLRDLAAIKAHESGRDQDSIYQCLRLREQQRVAGRRLRQAMGKVSSGLTKATYTDQHNDTQEATSKEQLEQAIHDENAAKYSQTNITPLMSGQLAAEIGFLGTSPARKQILQGNYEPPPNTSQYTSEFLQHLKKPPNIQQCPKAYVLTEDFREGWKKMKEQTQAGDSGLHFGHMKACAQSQFVSDFEATMSHIPHYSGLSPEIWKTSVNLMLQKKKKGNHVSMLRTICLFEADFNFNNKKVGRDMLKCAEVNKLIPREQYGSRKNKKAILHVFNKKLLYDVIHLQRRPALLCSNDAKSCYDRIIHSVASMACQRLGLPPEPITCMLVTIQEMEHHVRTAFGTSTSSMHGILPQPLQGIFQGNGAGPAIWVAVSAPLIEMMRTAGNTLKFETPLSQEKDEIVGFAFVDNTDIVAGDLSSTSLTFEEVAHSMQEGIDCWEGGLKATGGAIRPDKSFVYPISFSWDEKGNYSFDSVDHLNHHFTVENEFGIRETLPQIAN